MKTGGPARQRKTSISQNNNGEIEESLATIGDSLDIKTRLDSSHSATTRTTHSPNQTRLTPIKVIETFAKLRFGNNNQILFNIHCQIQILLNYFRQKCDGFNFMEEMNVDLSDDQIVIDVADTDGNIKNIHDKTIQTKFASDYLLPRDVYILIEIKSNTVVPLLKQSEYLTNSFIKKIAPPQTSKTKKGNSSSTSTAAAAATTSKTLNLNQEQPKSSTNTFSNNNKQQRK
jgi:hypothetical protein